MKKHLPTLLFASAALAVAVTWFGGPAHGQTAAPAGVVIMHTPYNDLVAQVHDVGIKVFAGDDGRKANAAELLQAVSKLTVLVQKAIDLPGSEIGGPMGATMIRQLQANPAEAEHLKQLHTKQLRFLGIVRLALDEPAAVKANQAQMARGGADAADAAVDQAAADWLVAPHDTKSQREAFDKLRAAVDVSGEQTPLQIWHNLLEYRPPADATLAAALLEYLRPGDKECLETLLELQAQVQAAQIEGSALTLQGTLVSTGKHFSTAQWKGKVVLVDIYGANCKGADKGVAEVQNLLNQQHANGLEVLEIAHAPSLDSLKQFLAAHPTFQAPEIYRGPLQENQLDPPGATPDPTTRVGVLLIDRKGIAHEPGPAGQSLDAAIAKYLAEKP
jgi:hypothetical protein